MAHALIHILGSRSGYTTLDATPGVTAAERAELEVLSFGDATSSEAMARLEHSAVMTGRRLRSGRFAVSRMLPGGVDDAGRPTVEIITLLLDARAYTAAAGAFPRLADDARFWRVARGAVATGYELPEDRCAVAASDRGVMRAFDAWIAARKQGGVGVLPAADAGAVLAMVALLESVDQAQCRWGIGLLSLSAPVDLCTLAATASSSGPRPVVRASTGGAWHSPEMDHVSWHLEQRNPLLPRTDALVSAVRIEPALDEPASAAPFTRGAASAQRTPFAMQPRNLTKIAGISAACSLALLAVVTALYARGGRAANVDLPVAAEKTSAEPPASGESATRASTSSEDYANIAPPDRDGDGTPDQSDGCPDNKSLQAPIEYFKDQDGDGAGDPGQSIKACELPDGYVANSTDECPDNKSSRVLISYFKDQDGDKAGDPSQSIKACELPDGYVTNSTDECPDNKSLQVQTDFFMDQDSDGEGDPKKSKKACEQPDGYVATAGDGCPEVKSKTKPGDCGCDWPYADDLDLDKDTAPDCFGDDDGDGFANWQDTDYRPKARIERSDAQAKLKSIADAISDRRRSVEALSQDLSLEHYVKALGEEMSRLKPVEVELLELHKSLHKTSARLDGKAVDAKEPIQRPKHRFVRKIWPQPCDRDCGVDQTLDSAWSRVVEELISIVKAADFAEVGYGQRVAAKQAVSDTGNNNLNLERLKRKVREAVQTLPRKPGV